MLRSICSPSLCLSILLFCPVRLAAADDILTVLPNEVLGAFVVERPAELQSRLNQIAQRLGAPMPDLFALGRARAGLNAGIDPEGSVAFIAVSAADRPSGLAMIGCVATSDHQSLLESLAAKPINDQLSAAKLAGMDAVVGSKGGYALLARASDQAALQQILDSESQLAQQTKVLKSRLQTAHAFVLLTPSGLNMLQMQALNGLEAIKRQLPGTEQQRQQVAAGLGMYEQLFRSLDTEFTHLMLGLTVQEDLALRILSGGTLHPEGALAKTGAEKITIPEDKLEGLSARPFMFASGGVLPETLAHGMMAYSMNVLMQMYPSTDLSPEDMQTVQESMQKLLTDMQSMSVVMGTADDGEALYANTTFNIRTADPAAFLDSYQETIEQVNGIFSKADEPLFQYDLSRTKEGDVDVLKIEADMTNFIKSQAQMAGQEKMLEMMFGSDGTLGIYLAASKNSVMGQYISKEKLLQQLAAGGEAQALAQQSDVKMTLQLMPASAQGIALFSIPGIMSMASQMLEATQPNLPIQLPEFPDSPPVGMSLEITPDRLDLDTVVPTGVLDAITEYVRTIQTQRVRR